MDKTDEDIFAGEAKKMKLELEKKIWESDMSFETHSGCDALKRLKDQIRELSGARRSQESTIRKITKLTKNKIKALEAKAAHERRLKRSLEFKVKRLQRQLDAANARNKRKLSCGSNDDHELKKSLGETKYAQYKKILNKVSKPSRLRLLLSAVNGEDKVRGLEAKLANHEATIAFQNQFILKLERILFHEDEVLTKAKETKDRLVNKMNGMSVANCNETADLKHKLEQQNEVIANLEKSKTESENTETKLKEKLEVAKDTNALLQESVKDKRALIERLQEHVTELKEKLSDPEHHGLIIKTESQKS